MLTLLSMLCACFVANPQEVVKAQALTCADADAAQVCISKGQVREVRIASESPSVGHCKSACGATCGASGHACAVAGPGGAKKIMRMFAKPGCGVAIGGGASGAGCCPSAGSACGPPGGPICGVVGGQGARKIMCISEKPGCGVGIGGGACCPAGGPACGAAPGQGARKVIMRISGKAGCGSAIGCGGAGAGCCQSAGSACCPAGSASCGAAGQGAKKSVCTPGRLGGTVAISSGASGAACCPSAGGACCPPGGPICGVVGDDGAQKIMRIFATPAGAVGIGGGLPAPAFYGAVAGPSCLIAPGNDEQKLKRPRLSFPAVIEIKTIKHGVAEAPKAWLGVSTSPAPEALKAHIGRGGLMIGNIVVDSPADQAGLQRYDVVVSFDGKAIEGMEDLLQALGDTEQGETVEMVVIRKGKETKLTVTPGERPQDAAWEYKYEQEEEAVLDDQLVFRGHQLKLGPGGDVIFQPLGRLKDLPDALRGLQLLQRGDDDEDLILRFDTEDEAHGEMEIKIKIDRDGEVLVIHRTKDGKVTVERADKEGETSSATYDSVEELKKEDPEAYDTLRSRGFGHAEGLNWTFRYPGLEELPKLQKRYQTHIDLNLQKTLEKVREAQRDAERTAEKALRQYREARGKAEEKLHEGRRDAERRVDKALRLYREAQGKVAEVDLDITVHDDGSISVSVRKGDTRVTYGFKSKDDFKEREPELFEKFRDALE